MRRNILPGLLAFVALALGVPIAQASAITLPSGLNPGDTYYLAFVTADSTPATSPLIAFYDTFVTTEANSDADLAALLTTWKVIGSTLTDSAASHLGLLPYPIYNLAGAVVATGSSDLFDGSINNPIDLNQFGTTESSVVWAGSNVLGQSSWELGSTTGLTGLGVSDRTDQAWIDAAGLAGNTSSLPLYGISGPLVVPSAAVPEPGTISLMLASALLLLGRYRTRRRRPATRTTPSDPAVH